MRELTPDECSKLNEFRNILDEYNARKRATLWGRFNAIMSDAKGNRELLVEGIELFLRHDIDEIREEFLG